MTEEELIQRTRELTHRWDNLKIVGQGWAGNSRLGFQFNPPRTRGEVAAGPPTPTGACCPEDGDCFIATQAVCEGGGGTYQGDGTDCDPDPCPPTGACCVGTDCTIETEDDCTGMGGIYQGDNTVCDPNPCETGACCDGEDCSITTEEECTGIYQGDGTTCDPNPCLEPPCPCGGIPGLLGIGNYLVSTFHQTRTAHGVATPFVDECDLTLDISTITTVDPVTCAETVTCSGTITYHSDTAGDCSASWVSNGMGGCIESPSCPNCNGGTCESCSMTIDSDTHESCNCDYSDEAGNTVEYMAEVTLSSPCIP